MDKDKLLPVQTLKTGEVFNTSFGLYKIETVLGVGTYAYVYQVVQMESRAKFAVKVVEKRVLKPDKKLLQNLQQEIQIHSSIKNQFVAQFDKTFEDTKHHYLFMQLC